MKNWRIYGTSYFRWVAFCFVLSFSFVGWAQELPPVLSFSPKDYQADNQNWAITQGDNKHIYIANNKGLLEYDAETWRLYPSPNQSILRSVFFHEGRVYTGSFREFGYWETSDTGILHYTSLSKEIDTSIGTDEQFWSIDRLEDWIIFQSLDHIYTYHTKDLTLKKISIKGNISKMYKLGNDLYFQIINKGLFKLVDGAPVLVSDDPLFQSNLIINLYVLSNRVLVQTDTQGIYELSTSLKPWPAASQNLDDFTVYNSLQSRNGGLVLGTISQGVVFVSPEGRIENQISQEQTLQNNTVLSLFEDVDANIWAGLDNGVNCINVNSPISVFKDNDGILGTVYASLVDDGKLYVGTNQGLFYKSLADTSSEFKLVPNSNGQVWSLKKIDNTLFCGHNNGTFVFSTSKFNQVSDIMGTWCFKEIPDRPELILQGNYNGLSILEETTTGWRLKHKLKNFDISSKFVEFTSPHQILINHEYKGIYKLSLDSNFTKVDSIYQYESLQKGLYSSIAKFKDTVYYGYQGGIWQYNTGTDAFQKDTLLSTMYSEDYYTSGKLEVTDGELGLWTFNANSIDFTLQAKINDSFRLGSIPITSDVRGSMAGYENIYHIKGRQYLLGSTQGYMMIDYDKFLTSEFDQELSLSSVQYWENGLQPKPLSLDEPQSLENFSNIQFNFSVPYFDKYFATEYQYRLVGFIDEWSTWSANYEVIYNNLPFGDYEFEVRARIGDQYQTVLEGYTFRIKRPFLLSNEMLLFYVFCFLILISIIHSAHRIYYKKQKRKLLDQSNKELKLKELATQKEIIQLKNEQLEQDVVNKSRELANSTMNLINKNEFLNAIKSELQMSKPLDAKTKKVIKIIDKNLNNNDDWKMFEEAFNNADKDFLKKIKTKYPSLTPNDLRLCAYLRLNLSSKEIAPLFNISAKSVEVKRYRLRKKMDLDKEISLTDYILEM